MAYTGVYVFGDSLVDAGNALKLAEWYGGLPFTDLPDGAPTAAAGYFQGRFTNGYSFADLLANAAIGKVTKPVFPYGFEDPWIGIPIAPFASDPSGNNLNFAYGGAQVEQGDEVVQDLDSQTDTFRDALDGDAPSGALYIVTMGGNDVRSLAKAGSAPASVDEAHAALDAVAQQLTHELGQLIDDGARTFLITGIPDVGLIPKYDVDGSGDLDPIEADRAAAATQYSQYLEFLIRTDVVPALEAMGATVTYVPMMDYQDGATTVTGGLNAVLPTLEALYGLPPGTLTTNLLDYANLVFFDEVHPTAQVHALFGSYAQALLSGTPWVETLPLTGSEVDYSLTASIGAAGEVDKLVVAAVAGTTYRFEMLGISSLGTAGSLADPSLRLLGPSGNLIGANANDGAGFDAMLSFTAAASGNNTLELTATGSLTGSYLFQAAVVSGAAMQSGNSYTVDSATTLVIEGAGGVGTDTVRASVSYALTAGSEIEVLATTNAKGKGAINLTGNDFAQAITGNAGANVLEGKGGADVMTGGNGKDVFVLSNSAVTKPGAANIDAITDYERGEVVDITQILGVASGTNVVGGGYLRVTTGGLIQVDLSGGGNEWVTLSTVNGNSAVTLRYLSGGAATNVSVSRVAANTVLTSAIAAAGLMTVPAAAENAGVPPEGITLAAPTPRGGPDEPIAWGSIRPAFGMEAGQSVEVTAVQGWNSLASSPAQHGPEIHAIADSGTMAGVLTQLPQGTEALASHASLAGQFLAMPAAGMPASPRPVGAESMEAQGIAASTAEVGRIIADALGSGHAGVDALLDALPASSHAPETIPLLSAVPPGTGEMAFVTVHPAMEVIATHPDAVMGT